MTDPAKIFEEALDTEIMELQTALQIMVPGLKLLPDHKNVIRAAADQYAEALVIEFAQRLMSNPQTVKFSEDGKNYVVSVVFVEHIKHELAATEAKKEVEDE
jgi:hypothetical protein